MTLQFQFLCNILIGFPTKTCPKYLFNVLQNYLFLVETLRRNYDKLKITFFPFKWLPPKSIEYSAVKEGCSMLALHGSIESE